MEMEEILEYVKRSDHPNRTIALCKQLMEEYPLEIEQFEEKIKQLKVQIEIAREKLATRIAGANKLKQVVEQLEGDVETIRKSMEKALEKRSELRMKLTQVGGVQFTLGILGENLVEVKLDLAEKKTEQDELVQKHRTLLSEFKMLEKAKEKAAAEESYMKTQFWTAMQEKRQLEEKIQQLSNVISYGRA